MTSQLTQALPVLATLLLAGCQNLDGGPSTITFTPEGEGPGIRLALAQADPASGRVVLSIIGDGLQAVYGVAGQLTYDPTALEFVEHQAGRALQGGAATLVSAAAATADGMVFGFSRSGDFENGVTLAGQEIGRLTFRLSRRGRISLAFAPRGSAVIDTSPTSIEVPAWFGGTLVYE